MRDLTMAICTAASSGESQRAAVPLKSDRTSIAAVADALRVPFILETDL
jgi:hypothetical protein